MLPLRERRSGSESSSSGKKAVAHFFKVSPFKWGHKMMRHEKVEAANESAYRMSLRVLAD